MDNFLVLLYGLPILFSLIDIPVSIFRLIYYRKRDREKFEYSKDSLKFSLILVAGFLCGSLFWYYIGKLTY